MNEHHVADSTGTRIHVDEVSKSFQQSDGSRLHVLDDISFTADMQDFICLLGPSGCGKSTLLNLVAGLDTATRGEITVEGSRNDPTVGFVFQDPRLLDWRTVRSNLELALRGMGVPKREWDDRIDYYLELVDLADFVNEYPQALSGGMKQRVALARALAIESDVILMDEPFGSLDEITARGLRRDLIEIWAAERKTILFVTHNALEAAFLARRILVMSQRPASIIQDRRIDLDHPRNLDNPKLVEIAEACLDELEAHI